MVSIDTQRRKVLTTLAAGTTIGLAGCTGGGSDDIDEEDLGERVPPIVLEYWSDSGGTTTLFETIVPVITDSVEEAIGVEFDVEPVDHTTMTNRVINDVRENHFAIQGHGGTPDRLDPHEVTRRWGADWAGANGRSNLLNYADCDVTELGVAQEFESDPEQREQYVQEAHELMSEDKLFITLFPRINAGAYRPDEVNVEGELGGANWFNPNLAIESSPVDGDRIIANIDREHIETMNFPVVNSAAAHGVWSHLVNSTLTEYDSELELQNMLAEDITIEDDGLRYVIELRDATFHNGDEVTASDVIFTFEHLHDNIGAFPQATDLPIESYEEIDEKTVVFNLEEQYPPLLSREFPKWGILHEDSWIEQGAPDNPEGYDPDEMIGSGPFEIENIELGQSLSLTPHDGHPIHSPDHNITFQVYADERAIQQALISGEIDIGYDLSLSAINILEDEMDDDISSLVEPALFQHYLGPFYPRPPVKYEEFRDAVGKSLNRQEMVGLSQFGNNEPEFYSTLFSPTHPSRPPNENLHQFTDKPSGDPEAARQVLEDAGWGWDSNGNLHYPQDYEIEPLWPEEGIPSEEYGFGCIDSDGEVNI